MAATPRAAYSRDATAVAQALTATRMEVALLDGVASRAHMCRRSSAASSWLVAQFPAPYGALPNLLGPDQPVHLASSSGVSGHAKWKGTERRAARALPQRSAATADGWPPVRSPSSPR